MELRNDAERTEGIPQYKQFTNKGTVQIVKIMLESFYWVTNVTNHVLGEY